MHKIAVGYDNGVGPFFRFSPQFPLDPSSLPASRKNIQRAINLISNQRGGGTELYSALKRGLSLPRSEGTSRSMVVVTDGYITAESDDFELIQNNLNRTNVFAIGIGSSVNRYLIEGMARAGLGESFVILGPDQAGTKAEMFRSYISAPVLTDIKIQFDDFETTDIEPPSIPDLFPNRPVVVFGKWTGQRASGQHLHENIGGECDDEHNRNGRQQSAQEKCIPHRYPWGDCAPLLIEAVRSRTEFIRSKSRYSTYQSAIFQVSTASMMP